MNELITLIIHLTQKSKHILNMFARHQFHFLSQCLRWHFRKVWTRAMRDVANYDVVCDIHFWRQCWLSLHSQDMEWQWHQPHNDRPWVQRSSICFCDKPSVSRWCWITMHYLSKLECRVDIWIQWHTIMQEKNKKDWYCWKPTTRGQCLPLL
jgi:hypothetical protein